MGLVGHTVRYVRSFETSGWYKFNDSLVTAAADDLFAKPVHSPSAHTRPRTDARARTWHMV